MKKILLPLLLLPALALGQTFPVNNLQINGAVSGNVTGTGNVVLQASPSMTNPTVTGSFTATGLVTTSDLASQAANTVLANATGSPASPTAFSIPSCSTSASALNWTSGTGFTCNTSILANNVSGTVAIANGGTGQTTMGTGVQAGLAANLNSSPNGFAGYALILTTGAGITPQEFGAVGNGSTDDTTALQSWLNASASSGQPAFCSTGTYKITKSLNVTATAVKVMGPGGNACAITPAMTGSNVTGTAAGATYSGVPSIRLTVTSTASAGAAVEVINVGGTTEANGAWPAVIVDSTHIDVVGPTFVHAFSSAGFLAFPVIADNPATVNSSQPNIDISGVYFATPSSNAAGTDAMILTGPPAGSNAYIHDLVVNGYRRGAMFYNSFAPIIKNVFFYNQLGAAIVANQDISFSNALLDHTEFFSNGNTNLEAAVILGGSVFVENPNIVFNQWSGNNSGGLLFAGTVFGATVIGNYLENNTAYNFNCTGSNNNGATITGNFFNYNSGTNSHSLVGCNAVTFSGNFLTNETLSFGGNAIIPATNSFQGTASITYPTIQPSYLINSTVATQAISSGAATNVTSLSVPQGNWMCSGGTLTHPAGTTTQSGNVTALSTVSANFPGSAPGQIAQSSSTSAGSFVGQDTGPVYYSFGSTTTLYLVAQVTYAVSTLTIDGDIHCMRIF